MSLANNEKITFINTIKTNLLQFVEIEKIVLFGSFINSNNPNDIDIAIIQNSNDDYLTLALKYRKILRELSKLISLDIVPIKANAKGLFLEEINKGQIIYER